MRDERLLGGALGASLLLIVGGARAEGENTVAKGEEAGRLPLSYTERPITLPRWILNPIGESNVTREDGTFVNLGLRAAFGVTDDFEVEANVLPLQLSPVRTYGQRDQPGPSIGTTYRVHRGGLEVALHLDATAFTLPGTAGAIVRPGILFRGHAFESLRIDFGMYVPVTASHTTTAGLALPFALAVDFAPPLHVGVSSGITVDSVDAPASIAIPLGAFAGYAIGGKDGPILDIDPFIRWPKLAADHPSGTSTLDTFQIGVELGGFFYL